LEELYSQLRGKFFIFIVYFGGLKNGIFAPGIFSCLYVGLILVSVYDLFSRYINKKCIILDEHGLTLKYQFSRKTHVLKRARSSIKQFYIVRSEEGYSLMLQTQANKKFDFLSKIKSYEHARYIEHFLEKQLKIVHTKVVGEV